MRNLFVETDEEVDEILEEYLSLQERAKPILARIGEIRSWCKSKGSFSTPNHVCSVELRIRIGLISKEEAIEIFTEAGVRSLGLLKQSEYELIHVSRKP